MPTDLSAVAQQYLCLEEHFSALVRGKNSDCRVCVLEVCAARDSPLTNAVRQRLHDISSAERWTSRDHDLSKTSGRRSALTNLELVRPDHAVFFPPCSGFNEAIERNTLSIRAACWFENNCPLEIDSEISACDAGHLLESTNRFVHARFGATSNTFADLSKCFCLHVFAGGV